MELTDKIRRPTFPMTETGFYILFCSQRRTMVMVLHKRSKRCIGDLQVLVLNYVWNPVKDRKGWSISLSEKRENEKSNVITDLVESFRD